MSNENKNIISTFFIEKESNKFNPNSYQYVLIIYEETDSPRDIERQTFHNDWNSIIREILTYDNGIEKLESKFKVPLDGKSRF